MVCQNGDLSPALLAAQQRLFTLRAQQREEGKQLPVSSDRSRSSDRSLLTDDRLPITVLPAHLGWGSAAFTAVLRTHTSQTSMLPAYNKKAGGRREEMGVETAVAGVTSAKAADPNPHDLVKLYPDITRGMLQQEQAAAGRIWLLCRYLDQVGQGWLRVAALRDTLTTTKSPVRVCGWRQLRNLLHQGNGIFWTRSKERIWLKSAANVAAALGVERLSGRPVAVPVHVLTSTIGQVRAHLYAAFHSGRSRTDRRRPIARDTLVELTGVGRRTQLVYEARTGLAVQHNYGIGTRYSPETAENHAWHRGQATFVLQDSYGEQGKAGRSYIAWQLPNSYGGCHAYAPQGRQRRINRKLADLVIKRAPGNSKVRLSKRYYPDGKQAVKAASHHPQWEVYWWRQRTRNGRSDLWQQVR